MSLAAAVQSLSHFDSFATACQATVGLQLAQNQQHQHTALQAWADSRSVCVAQVHEHAQLLIQGMALAQLMRNANRVQMAHIPCLGDTQLYSEQARTMLKTLQVGLLPCIALSLGTCSRGVLSNKHLNVGCLLTFKSVLVSQWLLQTLAVKRRVSQQR